MAPKQEQGARSHRYIHSPVCPLTRPHSPPLGDVRARAFLTPCPVSVHYQQETANLDEVQLEFIPYLCVALLDKGTVNVDSTVTFRFRDGSEQEIAINS
jgi:hypothetical protein